MKDLESLDAAFVIDTFLLLLIGIGPKIALVPFLEATAAMPEAVKRRVLRKMLTTAAIVAVLLLVLGGLLTRLLHFSPGALGVASAASSYVCPVDDAAEPFVVGVVVAPDDVPADHARLLCVAGVIGAVQREVPQGCERGCGLTRTNSWAYKRSRRYSPSPRSRPGRPWPCSGAG